MTNAEDAVMLAPSSSTCTPSSSLQSAIPKTQSSPREGGSSAAHKKERLASIAARDSIKKNLNSVVITISSSSGSENRSGERPQKKKRKIEGELKKRPLPQKTKISKVQRSVDVGEKPRPEIASEAGLPVRSAEEVPKNADANIEKDVVNATDAGDQVPSPPKLGQHEILVGRKTSFAVYLRRCKKMIFQQGAERLTFQATGAAITRALEIALVLRDEVGGSTKWQLDVYTGTAKLVDDVLPREECEAPSTQIESTNPAQGVTQTRMNSCIKIILTQIARADRERAKRNKRRQKRRDKAKQKESIPEEEDIEVIVL